MIVQVVYCNHSTANLTVRERLAFSSAEQMRRAYGSMQKIFPHSEFVFLSTCNRVELYSAQENPQTHPTRKTIAQFLSDFHDIPLDQFVDDLLCESGPEAVRHLFEVASSLDSMVLGEPQIVSQVKEAYRLAQENDTCGPLTHVLFQDAIRVSARVRSETRLSAGRVSIASVAIGDFAKSIFDQFSDKTALVIGAGEMAEETLRYIKDVGVEQVIVINRSRERAEKLAAEWGGTVKPFDELDEWMARADLIVSATGAERPIVDAARFREVRRQSKEKPVFVLDLGAPRDFDPEVGNIDDGVFLYDIDDLEATCDKNRQLRTEEIARASKIIRQETDRFIHDFYHRATGPIIKRLREEWHEVRQDEVARLISKLGHLDEGDHKEIEKTFERVINKLLHPPLEALRDEAKAGTPHGLVDALRRLFHLRE